MKIIDLSHTIIDQMQVFPDDLPPSLAQTHCIETNGYTDHRLTLGMHTGTHIDGPWHMVDGKQHIANMPLEGFMGKACVVDIRNCDEFDDSQLLRTKAAGCHIVLFYTGYGDFFGSERYVWGYPLLSKRVAQTIVDMGMKLIGVDSFSPDAAPYETHKTLLGAGVVIAENLTNLHLLLDIPDFEVIALPIKIAADSAPARIVAVVREKVFYIENHIDT
jgi:kynurenine formamidase